MESEMLKLGQVFRTVQLAIALACGADNGRHCVRIDGGEAGEIA